MQVPLSKNILNYFKCTIKEEPELRKSLNNILTKTCKPCWELKYCPYGVLVEDFPSPPELLEQHKKHIEYLKECLNTGKIGSEHNTPLDDPRRKIIKDDVAHEKQSEKNCVKKLSQFEKEATCKVFGHFCPVYFVSETSTETSKKRVLSRGLSNSTIIRVARRDNNICQICGKTLLDSEIEIDHIIPFSRGGTSDEDNLRVTCRECNRRKGKKIEL